MSWEDRRSTKDDMEREGEGGVVDSSSEESESENGWRVEEEVERSREAGRETSNLAL